VKNTGDINMVYNQEPEETQESQQEQAVDIRKWFQKANPDFISEMPIVGRPRGKGCRLDYYVEGQLPDMALEIKEGSHKRFKNTNDVHRAAHYIGMYLLREKILSGKDECELGYIYEMYERGSMDTHTKKSIRNLTMSCYEQFVEGFISEEKLLDDLGEILKSIKTKDIKTWAKGDMERIINDESISENIRNKMRMRKHRERAESLKLSVLSRRPESVEA